MLKPRNLRWVCAISGERAARFVSTDGRWGSGRAERNGDTLNCEGNQYAPIVEGFQEDLMERLSGYPRSQNRDLGT
jgi:hypothetical protein